MEVVKVGDKRNLRAALLFALAVLATPVAFAQKSGVAPPQQVTTYFLIDASGSMKGKLAEAERKVSDRLAEITAKDPQAPVSRTYFGADNGGECGSRIAISPVSAARQSEPKKQILANDSSQLGSALEAAISDAGDRPANIIIFTDADQTPTCGVDICVAAETYLPRDNIKVETVFIGANAANQDRLGCVQGAQLQKGTKPPSAPQEEPPTIEPWWSDKYLFPKLLWLITIVFFVSSAMRFTFHYSDRASRVERDIKTYDHTDEGRAANDAHLLARKNGKAGLSSWGIAFAVIAAGLFALMWLYPSAFFMIAREEGLANLDTQFGASLLLASSLTLAGFSASQFWRYLEARREYFVVSERANAERTDRENRRNQRMIAEYAQLRQNVQAYDYSQDRLRLGKGLSEHGKATLNELFEKLTQLVIGQQPLAKIEQREINRLSRYRGWFAEPSLISVVRKLNSDHLLSDDIAQRLALLLDADQTQAAKEIESQIEQLLTELSGAN